MGKKLSKFDCEQIAEKLFEKTDFSEKEQEAKGRYQDFSWDLLHKYIPEDIWEIGKKYCGSWLAKSGGTYIISPLGGCRYMAFCDISPRDEKGYIKWPLLPDLSGGIKVTIEDYKEFVDTLKALEEIRVEARSWKSRVTEALYTLNSLKKIQEAFPEAVEFFPDSKKGVGTALAAYDYSNLRNHILPF